MFHRIRNDLQSLRLRLLKDGNGGGRFRFRLPNSSSSRGLGFKTTIPSLKTEKERRRLSRTREPRVVWCARQDLNLHAFRHYHLKVARLPIPPRAQLRGFQQHTLISIRALLESKMVGAVRFELTTSWTRTKRASQATLRPGPNAARKMGDHDG